MTTVIKYINQNFSLIITRDLVVFLESGYKIKNVIPVDMFPHTPHIESIVTLVK